MHINTLNEYSSKKSTAITGEARRPFMVTPPRRLTFRPRADTVESHDADVLTG